MLLRAAAQMNFEVAQSLLRASGFAASPGLRLKLSFMFMVDQDALTDRTLTLDAFRRNLRLSEKEVLGQSFLYLEARGSLATLFCKSKFTSPSLEPSGSLTHPG